MQDNSSQDDSPRPALRRSRTRRDPLGPESEIGAKLRAFYAEVEAEPIPTRLIELLEQLSEAEREAGT